MAVQQAPPTQSTHGATARIRRELMCVPKLRDEAGKKRTIKKCVRPPQVVLHGKVRSPSAARLERSRDTRRAEVGPPTDDKVRPDTAERAQH
eukprot:scaffold14472_cov115-Isochrysis_galbana.AAC.3